MKGYTCDDARDYIEDRYEAKKEAIEKHFMQPFHAQHASSLPMARYAPSEDDGSLSPKVP